MFDDIEKGEEGGRGGGEGILNEKRDRILDERIPCLFIRSRFSCETQMTRIQFVRLARLGKKEWRYHCTGKEARKPAKRGREKEDKAKRKLNLRHLGSWQAGIWVSARGERGCGKSVCVSEREKEGKMISSEEVEEGEASESIV